MKKQITERIIGYLIIAVIYLIAFFNGLKLFDLLEDLHLLLRFLIMTTFTTVVIFVFSLIFKNASIYDPYWSVLPMVISLKLFNIGLEIHPLSILMLGLIELWGLRLTINWAYSFKGLHKEDWRYTKFRTEHPKLFPLISLFGIHLFPTLVVYLLMMSPIQFFSVVNNGAVTNQFNISSVISVIIMVGAIVIEMIADIQSHYFRKKHPGEFIKIGLWKVSRHPNYFGEMTFWFGAYLLLISMCPNLWVLVLGPLVNLLMFAFISIPLMEKRMLKKYPEYEEYKKTTNVLIPLKNKERKNEV